MKFSKLFKLYKEDGDTLNEHYISIEDVFTFFKKSDDKANKYNLKRALQNLQGGPKTVCGRECATVLAVLKYFFSYASSSRACATVVKNIEHELLSEECTKPVSSSLELYKLVSKTYISQCSIVFEQISVNENNISTLIVDHKPYFTQSEWKRICWFENAFSREVDFQQRDLSYEQVLDLKYSKFQSLLNLVECSKYWIRSSDEQIRQKTLRYEATDKERQIRIACGQEHIASILDSEIKSLTDTYCPGNIAHTVCFDVIQSRNTNSLWAVFFQNKELEVTFDDLCLRVFYLLKTKHKVYLESVLLIQSEALKEYVSEDDKVYRFTLRDAVETKQFQNVSKTWNAGTQIDGTIEYGEQNQCELCFSGILSKPLSTDNFNTVQEWFLELPIETQILLENFINKETIRRHKTPEIFLKKKLEKLYSVYDILLNIHNKKFNGVFQKSNSSKLLIEYKSIGSVFNITSAAGATSSLNQAEAELKGSTCKDLCYYNTYLKEHNLPYGAATGETKTWVNLRSCHLILMLDNLVRLQYIADPNPGEHRSKQLCTLPITLQGLPLDSSVTEGWHLADCDGQFNCLCKQPVDLQKDDIQHAMLESDQTEGMLYSQFFNLMTFGLPELWKKLPDNLLEHIEGRKVEQEVRVDENDDQTTASTDAEDDNGMGRIQNREESSELDEDLVNVLLSFDSKLQMNTDEETVESGDYSDDETEDLSTLEKSLENMSILEDDSEEKSSASVKDLLQSFGFSKNKVPPLLTRHPPPAIGRDDDISKIKEILDDVLIKMGYEADSNRRVNRILCGPDNKIGKCLLGLMSSDKKYRTFLPEFPLLHLRKSKINILFSSYKDAGLVQILRFMRNEEQEEWAKLISIQHIDMATRHIKRIALALHLAFLISFMEYIDQEELQEFLSYMETSACAETSSKWAEKFKQYLSYGSSRNSTFALHVDMMKHFDDVVAISLAERLGGKDGYGLLLAVVKSSLLFSFVNNASAYAPYCVRLLYCHYSAGYFHQCLKKELYSTPFKGSSRNFASDTKREMDHLDALKGFRSGSTVSSATCRMSLIDSLNETQTQKLPPSDSKQEDDDKLGWELTEVDLSHIYPTTALILRRQALSLEDDLVPYNVYSKVPIVLPSSILDSCSNEVGKYLLMRYLRKEKLFHLDPSDSLKEDDLQGPTDLVNRAKRSKGVTIKRTIKSNIRPIRSERETKEEIRQKEVNKQSKIFDCFSSENNACQALLKADSSKPKVLKSIGMQRALINLIRTCGDHQSLDQYMALNLACIPKAVTNAMKICTIEFAGVKFKTGNIKTGQEYLDIVEKMLNGITGKSTRISKVIICEEIYTRLLQS